MTKIRILEDLIIGSEGTERGLCLNGSYNYDGITLSKGVVDFLVRGKKVEFIEEVGDEKHRAG